MAVAGEATMQAVGSAGLGGRGSRLGGGLREAQQMSPGRGRDPSAGSPRAKRAAGPRPLAARPLGWFAAEAKTSNLQMLIDSRGGEVHEMCWLLQAGGWRAWHVRGSKASKEARELFQGPDRPDPVFRRGRAPVDKRESIQ